MKNWKQFTFENAPLEIIDGDRGVNYPKQADFMPFGHCLFLNAGNVTENGFDFSNCSFISEEKDKKLRKGKLSRQDIVLTTRGTVGNLAFYNEKVSYDHIRINSGMVIFRVDQNEIFPRYFYFLLKSNIFKEQVKAYATGSAQPQLPIRDIKRFEFLLPPLPEQRAIAEVLGALDDKIELNRRMNRTLEAMARAVFRHWFVENEEVESWKVGKLGDLVTLINERVDATPQKDNEKYIALDDMPSKSIDLSQYRLGSEVNSSIISFKRGDILFGSMRPYFHKVGIAPFDGITRTTTFVLRPKKDIFRAFALYWFFSDEVIEFSTTASVGTTIPYVRWETLENYEIPIPSHSLMEKFTKFFQPLWLKIVSNGKQSRTLAALRDALLPKLMSGEVRVRP